MTHIKEKKIKTWVLSSMVFGLWNLYDEKKLKIENKDWAKKKKKQR